MSDPPSIATDPFVQFAEWLKLATQSDLPEPTAMAVATADAGGVPNVRMLLLKGVDERGFVFYTNLASPKAAELTVNPHAALCFYWDRIKRQVRVSGPVVRVTDTEADAYFATRPRLSQIGAWASHQSQPMTDRFELERNCASEALRFGLAAVPRPPSWSGYRVVPDTMEFWQEKPFRLHERVRFTRTGGTWAAQRIFP
ncbi:MAG: pyridoxamine 5'-phosphate oxidase [Opitutaceae bacterium]|nr:pyridoxamine 5'-phosphate oxidase [Opitutaceae bacterium]